jgi:glyoxylase-like metal-dependent hydrolase (beta-lactamase superfamily II)
MISWQDFAARNGGAKAVRLADGVWRLWEPALSRDCRSYFYLLAMPQALVMIEGGWGLVADREILLKATGEIVPDDERPLVALATHSHSDHIGALHLADTRYGHRLEASVYADPDPYATQARPWIDGLCFAIDDVRVDPATYCQKPCPLTHHLEEGDILDFGGGVLTILHTPGHSPGSLSVLHEKTGLLFCADTVHDGEIHDTISGADAALLDLSHSRLLAVDFVQACPGHGSILSVTDVATRIARYRRDKGAADGRRHAGACI